MKCRARTVHRRSCPLIYRESEQEVNPNPKPGANPITGGSEKMDRKAKVAFKDEIIDPTTAISARLYLPESQGTKQKKLPVLIYFHGGGFTGGSAFSPLWHDFIYSLSSQAHLLTVSVNYRLAPKHRLPAAYDDSCTALRWVLSRADPWLAEHGDIDRLFVSGDSAGANIAHQLVMRLGDHYEAAGVVTKMEGLVLVHPFFLGTKPIGAERANAKAAREMYDRMLSVVMPPGMEMDDPRINPIAEGAPSLAGLGCRRIMVCVASEDELVDRGRTYYGALKASRWEGEAEIFESEGEGHCFHLFKPHSERALELMAKLVAFFLRP